MLKMIFTLQSDDSISPSWLTASPAKLSWPSCELTRFWVVISDLAQTLNSKYGALSHDLAPIGLWSGAMGD